MIGSNDNNRSANPLGHPLHPLLRTANAASQELSAQEPASRGGGRDAETNEAYSSQAEDASVPQPAEHTEVSPPSLLQPPISPKEESPDGVKQRESTAGAAKEEAQQQQREAAIPHSGDKGKLPHAPSDWSTATPSHPFHSTNTASQEVRAERTSRGGGRATEASSRRMEGKLPHAPSDWSTASPSRPFHSTDTASHASSQEVRAEPTSQGGGRATEPSGGRTEGKLPHALSDWSTASLSHPFHSTNTASQEVRAEPTSRGGGRAIEASGGWSLEQAKLPHAPSDWSSASAIRPLHSTNPASHASSQEVRAEPTSQGGGRATEASGGRTEEQGKLPHAPSDWSSASRSHPLQHSTNTASRASSQEVRTEPPSWGGACSQGGGRAAEASGARVEEEGDAPVPAPEPIVRVEMPPSPRTPSSSNESKESLGDVKHKKSSSSSGGPAKEEAHEKKEKGIFHFLDKVRQVPFDRFAVKPRPRTILGQFLTLCILAATAIYIAYMVERWMNEPPTTKSTLIPSISAGPFLVSVTCRARSGCIVYNGVSPAFTDGAAPRANDILPIKQCISLPYTDSMVVPLVYSLSPDEGLTLQWDASSTDESVPPGCGLVMGQQTRCALVDLKGFCQQGVSPPITPGTGGVLYASLKNDTRAGSGEQRDLYYPHMETSIGARDASTFLCTPDPEWKDAVQALLRLDYYFYYAIWVQQEFWLYLWGSAGGAFGSFMELALGILFIWGIVAHLYLKHFEPAVKLSFSRPSSRHFETAQPV